ncbi:hypothetical protein VTL71DRAFT_9977 [Oculimacula yallundae]
MPKSS